MQAQKVEQQAVAPATVLEQLAGKTPVEKFHATSDRARLVHFRETAQERFKVDFQYRVHGVLLTVNQSFLDVQKFTDRYFLDRHHIAVQPQITPAPDPGTQGKVKPVGVDDRFLGGSQHPLYRGSGKAVATGGFTQPGKGILHLVTQQQRLAEIMQLVKHEMGIVARFPEVTSQ